MTCNEKEDSKMALNYLIIGIIISTVILIGIMSIGDKPDLRF